MTFPSGQTITRIRGAVNTRSGMWTEASRVDIAGCAVDSTSTAEQTGTQDTVQVNATVYAPFGADVQPTDRVLIGTELYDVVGERADWQSPWTGRQAGSVIRLVRHTG